MSVVFHCSKFVCESVMVHKIAFPHVRVSFKAVAVFCTNVGVQLVKMYQLVHLIVFQFPHLSQVLHVSVLMCAIIRDINTFSSLLTHCHLWLITLCFAYCFSLYNWSSVHVMFKICVTGQFRSTKNTSC